MKLLVPGGFMPGLSASGVGIVPCSGTAPMVMVMVMMPGTAAERGRDHHAPARPDAPCGFAGLAMPSLGGADPVQLAIALVAIVAAVPAAPARAPIRRVAYLRLPSRGPPARASTDGGRDGGAAGACRQWQIIAIAPQG